MLIPKVAFGEVWALAINAKEMIAINVSNELRNAFVIFSPFVGAGSASFI
jgi:hypothetical protein